MESQPCSDVTNNSGLQGNQSFFHNHQQQLAVVPSHTASITWKSAWVKEKEEYERLKQRVRHFAPALFKVDARPEVDPTQVFPQNRSEWVEHKRGYLAMVEAEKRKDIMNLKAQIAAMEKKPSGQKQIMRAFRGKVFKDGLSAVLALPTVFSVNYDGFGQGISNWPSRGELQWNGDSRQNGHAKTKCGRFLPPPRVPAISAISFQEQYFMRPWPLDETGPIHTMGARPDEVQYENAIMDNDPEFEATGAAWLGSDLMAEVGEWSEPYVPEQQPAEFQPVVENPETQYAYMEEGMVPGFQYELPYNIPGQQYWDEEQEQEQALVDGEGNTWY